MARIITDGATCISPKRSSRARFNAPRADRTKRLGSYAVLRKEDLDGVKFFLDAPTNGNGADAWVLFRASGTEPLLRVYAEAASPELVEEILASGENFCERA